MKKIIFPLACFILIFSSCRKNNEDSNGELLVKKVVTGSDSGDAMTFYRYNANQQFVQIKTAVVGYRSFNYGQLFDRDMNGHIWRIGTYSNAHSHDTVYQEILYDANGRASLMSDSSILFYYNNVGRVNKTVYLSQGGKLELGYTEWIYDETGNIRKTVKHIKNNYNQDYVIQQLVYEYDNKKNPLYTTDDALIIYYETDNYISPNNIISAKSLKDDGTPNYPYILNGYKYQANGLPKNVDIVFPGVGTLKGKFIYK